jgi:transcriptional regulator with PAS, ATPase and Fis domain
MTDDIIREVYEMTGQNKNQTAQLLGISRTTVWKKLKY